MLPQKQNSDNRLETPSLEGTGQRKVAIRISTGRVRQTIRCMFHHFSSRLLHFLAGLILATAPARADMAAYSEPRGIYTVKVAGAVAGSPTRTYIGIQLLPDTRFRGPTATVSGNTVSLAGIAPYQALETPGRISYLHVLGGTGAGFVTDILQYRDEDMVCAENLEPWLQSGTLVNLRPHSTLADIMGENNPFGLAAGADALSADNVVVWDPVTQSEKVYYFHSVRGRWEEKDVVADAAGAPFRFPYGFYIVRRSSGTLRIALSGEINSFPVLLPVRSGANVFSLPLNLSGSLEALMNAGGAHAVISGPNAATADILAFEEPSTGNQRGPFYHLSRPGESGWREVGVDGSQAAIEPLDFLSTLILRRQGNSGPVLAQASLDPPPVPRPPLPPDPEPGEIPLTGELPAAFPPGMSAEVQISTDLQTWQSHENVILQNGKATFDLPSGQRRAFYRLKISLSGF